MSDVNLKRRKIFYSLLKIKRWSHNSTNFYFNSKSIIIFLVFSLSGDLYHFQLIIANTRSGLNNLTWNNAHLSRYDAICLLFFLLISRPQSWYQYTQNIKLNKMNYNKSACLNENYRKMFHTALYFTFHDLFPNHIKPSSCQIRLNQTANSRLLVLFLFWSYVFNTFVF